MAALPDIKSRILAVLNAKNSKNVTLSQVTFDNPAPNYLSDGVTIDPDNNTVVNVNAVTGSSSYIGTQPVYYNRRDLDAWIASQPSAYTATLPEGAPFGDGKTVCAMASILGLGTVADLLPVLNSVYNGGFTLDDFPDGDLPTDITTNPFFLLEAHPNSYQYTGSLGILFYDPSTVSPMSTVFADATLGDIPAGTSSVDPQSSGGTTNL